MGHWSTHFTGHMRDMNGGQQNQPCIFYENFTSLPQPHPPTFVPGLGTKFHEGASNYRVPQMHSIQPQHSVPNLDLNFAPPSGHFTQYLEPPPSVGDFPIGCFPVSSYNRNIPYMDDIRGAYKRKNADLRHGNYQYHNVSGGPSSSIPTMSVAETSCCGVMSNQPYVIGVEPFLVHNANQLVLGNHASLPIQMPGNRWLDMNYHLNNEAAWTPAPLHYVHGLVAFQGFQIPANNGSSHVFVHPPPHLVPSNPHQPPLSMLVPRGSTDLASSGFRFHRPQETTVEPSARHQSFPQMRFLPEEETAILEIPEYNEPRDPVDQHHEMRLDIDNMSYEELLTLEEQMGIVGTGLSLDFIQSNLKTRACTLSTAQQICVICQSNYKEEKGEIATLKCKHEYHSECLKKWLVIKNTCPICKATALTSNKNL